ncbi:hypothetical protein C1N53_10125 [Pontibacter sp. SGAir0037]|nr:hypothetical protein C1N53_10125 [Pontibacter sp. SGAir0037]
MVLDIKGNNIVIYNVNTILLKPFFVNEQLLASQLKAKSVYRLQCFGKLKQDLFRLANCQ